MPRGRRSRAPRDDARDDDELRDVSPSEAYGFAGMALTTLAFALWLVGVFASEATLERLGAPSGAAARHYARALPMWLIASCLYAFVGYECLNLMSTPDDAATTFGATDPDPSEYVLDGGRRANETFDLDEGLRSSIPLFRDISQAEVTARMFRERGDAAADAEAKSRTRTTRSRSKKAS
jgi:phosphatidylinositol glycan class P protein